MSPERRSAMADRVLVDLYRQGATTWRGVDAAKDELLTAALGETIQVSEDLAQRLEADDPTGWQVRDRVEMFSAVTVAATSGVETSDAVSGLTYDYLDIIVNATIAGTGSGLAVTVEESSDGGSTYASTLVTDLSTKFADRVVSAGKTFTTTGATILRLDHRAEDVVLVATNSNNADCTITATAFGRRGPMPVN
jgi:hypothetical protein